MSVLSQSRSTSNISRMRQLFETTTSSEQSNRPVPLSRCRSEVITTRGFKPSDIKDPSKTRILQDLTFKMWGRTMHEGISSDIPNGVSKPIDFQKLFTPADDAPEIQPRNKKMFASSSFYGPNHPTVEEQVELARRISSSLSDISNRESKGQSMYVNRKKRSVKWVHSAGEEQQQQSFSEFSEVSQSENFPPTPKVTDKPVLKLVMNPRGQVQDFSSLKSHVDATPSPEVCFDLVKDLNSPCGKGAELFAKRRKKAEKWVVDESNVKQSSHQEMSSFESSSYSHVTNQTLGKVVSPGLPTNLANLPTPSYLKDVPPRFGPQAVKNQIPEKYTQPKVRLIKSPWEAALEGSVENAFQETHSAPIPSGNVMQAPSPGSFNKMANPAPSQSYAPPADIYNTKPPKAWHPQPTGKQLSTVNLEKIFEGSPRSPVSLAYNADTNTLSSEPVMVENNPPFVKLYDYEIIDPSNLREDPIRRPEQTMEEVQPVRIEPPKSPIGGMCPQSNQDSDGSTIMPINPAYHFKHPQSVQLYSCPTFTNPSPSNIPKQKLSWPPPIFLPDDDENQDVSNPMYIRQLSKSPQPTYVRQRSLSPQPAFARERSKSPLPQGPPKFPQVASALGKQIQQLQHTNLQESLRPNTLQRSLSDIHTAMSQASQHFTRTETGITESQSSQLSIQEVFHRSQKSEIVEKETILQTLQSESSDQEKTQQIQSLQVPSVADRGMNETIENVQENQSNFVKSEETVDKKYETSIIESTGVPQTDQVETLTENLPSLVHTDGSEQIDNLNPAASVQEPSQTCTEVQFSQETLKKEEMSENISESIITSQSSSEKLGNEQHTEPFIPREPQQATNEVMAHSENNRAFEEISKTEESIQSISSSFKKEEISNSSQTISQSHTVNNESCFLASKLMQESMSSTNKTSEFHTQHAMNEVKQESYASNQGLCRLQGSQAVNSTGKTQFKSVQENQLRESSNRISLSATDEEVQDLCEREFNQVSMQYEKVTKPEIKKPAAIIPPGAVKIFPPGNESMSVAQRDSLVGKGAPVKKPYKKPASMVPGARSLFGEAVELNFGQVGPQSDKPYEQIPVRNLIKTFEESTRPFMQYKMKTPDTPQFINPPSFINPTPEEEPMVQQSFFQPSTFVLPTKTCLYSTFPEDDPIHRGETMSQLDLHKTNVVQSTPAPKPAVKVKVVSNFNTAPRGWQSNMSFYRPITFSTGPSNQFTDF